MEQLAEPAASRWGEFVESRHAGQAGDFRSIGARPQQLQQRPIAVEQQQLLALAQFKFVEPIVVEQFRQQ